MSRFSIQSWEIQRRSGKGRFILMRGVLGWGCLMALVVSIMSWIKNSYTLSTAHFIVNFVICPLAGLIFGWRLWNRMEKKYQNELNKNHFKQAKQEPGDRQT
jgi:hypothetical protein